ncbi:MAG: 50S ribosomal protein L22 [Rickettsiales bacterium]|jgi:large subunit ribosomal protein L22|nr:50S ribosomal protein L22 [Rickettsiales bacterium]
MSEKIAVAYLKAVKSSPLKVQKLTGGLAGSPVSKVLDVLKFSKLKLAPIVRGLVYSAMSNAENNHNLDVDSLIIQRIDVGRAFALKRFSPRGRGKSSRILKTFSNIRVVLAEKKAEKVAPKKAAKKITKVQSKA